jgi:mannose-6-phosphate isomerase-like protein (cupin superfamily)
MQLQHLRFGHGFRVALGDDHSQAAQMTPGPGETEGGPDNRHRGAAQWLFVVSGEGQAVVEGERVELREGTLLLIQRGETHGIRNTGTEPLRTLNVYNPRSTPPRGTNCPPAGNDRSRLPIWRRRRWPGRPRQSGWLLHSRRSKG